ncbi:non-ribosomal peptide synthetase [Streptomyces liangshanensis]|uniref:Amino acid adenylation domain-containing protein n=1 Tax=Streptomyces liangshanensis TaxID=2717324 RepID=A0A6G9H1N2_9ACTN|nr:non-ribosomal peptide synthetase [Streptomyces liangshanensis]QIQ04384.1 amino acid adenylation domain-containing protein [Streptomyces liangshanensis]
MNDRTLSGSVPGPPLLPQLFAAQRTRTPDAPAVLRPDGSTVSYAGLGARADRFAAALREQGVGPGDFVGVCLRRGPDLIAGLLGVWLAGAAYVPLDPEHPESRIALVLADAGARVALAERSTADRLPEATAVLLTEDVGVRLAGDGGAPLADDGGAEQPLSVPRFVPDPARPAYVLHTSGSTGRPKGVLVPHGGIANRVRWLTHRHKLGPADRMLLKTTVGFDAAGLELFAPLISGGTVVLAPEGAERDPAALLAAVTSHGVTVLQGVPSVYRGLVEAAGRTHHAPSLRLLFSAGEPLHAELCRDLAVLAPGAGIWNTYGPTEASVDITEHHWDPERDSGPVPIGRPIGNMRVVVLDPAGRPVPVGVPGELHAGGVGLALGYAGRPDLTAERFVPDPHVEGARLYRTGDKVRWRADGTLEYLGRLDHQVKVNGVRVEPGEVEAALAAHPWVRAAVVAAVPDGDGGHRLAAWVQSRGQDLRPEELRAFLRRSLPDVLVPALFVPVDRWPLTASGKTDRGALPLPSAADLGGTHVPVRTTAERAVAEEWSKLIGTPAGDIGATHDFFQLGGSSLMLTRLSGALSARAGAAIPLRVLFTETTVEAQAALLTRTASGTRQDGATDTTGDPDSAPGGRVSAPGGPESAPAAPDALLPVARPAEGLPLSHGQRSMWLLDRLRPGSSEWNAPTFLTLPAHYADTTVLAALDALAARHEILRTRYVPLGAEPVQIADPPGARPVESRTVRATTPEALNALVHDEFTRPFDLENGPVWRALVIRGTDNAPALHVILSVHHIACDGWSSVVLERDLQALAEAAHTGTPAALPPLPVQYADHAAYRRRTLTDAVVGRELAHWKQVLAGITPLDLPADRPRPPVRDAAGAVHVFSVPPELTERAAALGRHAGATLQQTLLTAFATLVARFTGRWDIPVGVPVSGRERPEVADVVGFFLNTLVLRCELDPAGGFDDALIRVRDRARDAFAHQDLPFDALVEALDESRDPSRTPLYQVMFDLHEEGGTGTATGAADIEAFRGAWQAARTDLTFVVQRQPDGSLLGLVEYATALFDAATVERLCASWLRLLESVTADPRTGLREAGILPAPLLGEIVGRGPGAPEPGGAEPAEQSVYEAILASARRAPLDTALVCGDHTWTYERLMRRAGAFAHRLRALGAGAETPVGVMLGRTPDLVAAVLGTWQAGAAFVPLDPAAPDERLAHVLADAGARVLVTTTEGGRRLAPAFAGPVLDADTDGGLAAADDQALAPEAIADDPARLAYIMYTSGSTGRPKGVAVEHRTLLRTLSAFRDHLDFGQGPDDAYLALSQPTFDISCTELYMPLVAGGRVVLAQERDLTDHRAQIRLIDRHAVSHMQAAPPHWQMLLDAGFGRRPLVGKTGGEPTPPALARELARGLTRFINEYGLTETTIASTRWDGDDTARSVPLGRPYPGVTTRVLDEYLVPVPYGVTGELCIGGPVLARGYRGRPDLTAAAFVPDPYGEPGARLYRTGDMARMLPDGTLEFAGRADGQVKIRGRRVETGEVQGVLAEHPSVAHAVVVVHGTGDEAALIGYWVPAEDRPVPGDSDLLDHCARRLPDYMVPALLMPIDHVPLTRHNKVDIAALPTPDLTAALADEPYTPPQGPVEELIADIWAEALYGPDHVEGHRVGARQGFFRIGGNSVRAARVVARIQEEFDVEIPLRTVFERPTVTGLAAAVEEAVTAEIESLTEAELAVAHREYQP